MLLCDVLDTEVQGEDGEYIEEPSEYFTNVLCAWEDLQEWYGYWDNRT